jgi:single-strand DNA-binding protein
MLTLNHVELVGSLSRDPEVRYTSEGKPYTEFFVTVNHHLHSAHAECNGPTDRFLVNAVGKLGRLCLQQLRHGQLVQIEGQLHSQSYRDAVSGELRLCTMVVATRMQGLEHQPGSLDARSKTDAEPVWLAL